MVTTIVPVSRTLLTRIFTDQEIIQRMEEVNTYPLNEAGFVVHYDVRTGRYLASSVQEGTTFSMGNWNWREGIPRTFASVPLITYHSHADDEIIIPSGFEEGGDLRAWYETRQEHREDTSLPGLDVRTVHAVTRYQDQHDPLEILLVQERDEPQLPLSELQARTRLIYTLNFYRNASPTDIVRELGNSYRCALIYLRKKDEKRKENGFSPSDLKKIRGFAFSPAIVDKERFDKNY